MTASFKRVAVVGTGTLGAQIAMMAANAGAQVTAYDRRTGAFGDTLATLRRDFEAKGITPFIPSDRWPYLQEAIRISTDLREAVEAADLVIEAVPEDLALKRRIFRELGEHAPARAVLATNSSSLPVSRLEEAGGRPDRVLNIHFYQPLQGMNMADVMGGSRTLPEVLAQGVEWVRSLGCVPLTVRRELLGFCFNRVWRAVKKEVLHMWAGGHVDLRDVDRGWMIFTGMKEGPFAFMDKVGLDVVYDIEMVYHRETGDPADAPPEELRQMIERGELGIKTGKGFYTYPDPEFLRSDFLSPEGGG